MMKLMNPVPFYAGDDGGAGGGKDDEAAAAAAAAAAAGDGQDDADKDKGGKGGDGSFLDGVDDLADNGGGDKGGKGGDTWPDDWRDRMAGDDKELRKALDRYPTPAAVAKANREAQVKLRSGKPADDEPMPDPEKEPEKAKEWRKARGIPDDPTGYAIPDTVKALVTDADKPRLADFTEKMHAKGLSAAAVGPVMEWYFQEQAAAAEAISTADKADKADVEEVLREEWGPDFKPNSTIAKRFAEEITPGIDWFSARLPDGRVLGNIAEFVKALAELGRDRFGDVSLAGVENANKTMARKEELEKMMADDPDAYAANPKLSQEYTRIMEAEQRAAGRDTGSRHSARP